MVSLIVGKKGSGKTKQLIQLCNEAVDSSQGNVVVVEKGSGLTYDVSHKARLVDTDVYGVKGYEMLTGFISGICAGNYDVTDVFVDSTFKICPEALEGFEKFVANMQSLSKESDSNICLLVSADKGELSEELQSLCK